MRPRPAVRAVVLAVSAVLAAACIQIEEGSAKRAAGDSTARAIAKLPAGPIPVRGAYGPDSATPIRRLRPEQIDSALRTDTARTLEVADEGSVAAPTGADLATLRRELIVPVQGVAPGALRDTYTELRGGTRPHEATDIPAARGTPVLSAADGRVLKLFTSKAGGLMVYATDSTQRFILMYAHLDAYAPGLAEGQPLRRGQPIGTVGTSGNAPPDVPHLHFAIARTNDVKVWWKGVPMNPYPLLAP